MNAWANKLEPGPESALLSITGYLMHILYIHQHFATPKGSTGTRSYEFARRWIAEGHKVTVLTGYYDIGGFAPRRRLLHRETIDGIEVLVVGTKYSNKQSFSRRVISFITFFVLGIYAGLTVRKIDIIYATSTPLTVGLSAVILKWSRRVPYVFEVRDQWPEVPIGMGIIRNSLAIAILRWFERFIYEKAGAVVALSPGMAHGVRSAVRKSKTIKTIPNSSDTKLFHPGVDGASLRKQMGWHDELVLMHYGAMGKANGLDFVLDAAKILKTHKHLRFVLIGDGSEKSTLLRRIEQEKLENVELLDSRPKSELPKFVAACDVALVIFANYPVLQHNSANKFFDSLSAGKPILLNYSGWQRELIEYAHAGLGCDLYNLDEFVEKVRYMGSHPKELVQMGKNARRLAVKRFDRDILANQALEVLTSVKS
ncbi:MAG: glycosyltransferase family 4 protein [Planctomycetota bacterium]|jgi:glycosyltransferase involved in cell wall biosynthesis